MNEANQPGTLMLCCAGWHTFLLHHFAIFVGNLTHTIWCVNNKRDMEIVSEEAASRCCPSTVIVQSCTGSVKYTHNHPHQSRFETLLDSCLSLCVPHDHVLIIFGKAQVSKQNFISHTYFSSTFQVPTRNLFEFICVFNLFVLFLQHNFCGFH